MNKYFLCSILIALTATACTLDDRNICPRENCECFIDNNGKPQLTNCSQYIPEHSHATGCDYEQQCTFDCDEGYILSVSDDRSACIPKDAGCDSNQFKTPLCSDNNLMACNASTNRWTPLHLCTKGCDKDHCISTCNENEIGTHRCLDDGTTYQVCKPNTYELVWTDSPCPSGCNPETNECDSHEECKNGLSANGEGCTPWIECSEDTIVIDVGLPKTIRLYYYGASGLPETGAQFTLQPTTENCISLSRNDPISGPNGTELILTPGPTPCNTDLIIKAEGVQTSLSVPVTVREPKDDNKNNMFDVLELASKQNEPCRTDEDCSGDIPGFCNSVIDMRCDTPCKSDSDCISDQFYCRHDNRCSAKAFETIWDVPEDNKKLVLPTQYATECNFDIDWGDENIDSFPTCPGKNIEHSYAKAGQYHVKITGTYKNWAFTDDKKIKTNPACDNFRGVVSYGPVGLAGIKFYVFFKCKNNDYAVRPLDIPDPAELTNMAYMFSGNEKFNQPIEYWDTSNVTNLSHAFEDASIFNRPIGNWNTSKVTTLNNAFRNAKEFNQDLDGWDTSSVEHMQEVFSSASSFNGKISNWNTSKAIKMSKMFLNAESFNQDLNDWDVSNATTMSAMFQNAKAFNGMITNWNTHKVTNMSDMFNGAEAFNQPLEWDVGMVTTMNRMFANAKSFNETLEFAFNLSCTFDNMFDGAASFNHPSINNWDVSNGKRFVYMFKNAKAFNQPLQNWRPNASSMEGMFNGAESFNQNISIWNPPDAHLIHHFFQGAKNYDQPLEWDLPTLADSTNVSNMFKDTKLSKENYCKTVKGKSIEKYANALGVDYDPADCP